MKRITTFLVGLAFATAGGIGGAWADVGDPADDFPLPLPADITESQVFAAIETDFALLSGSQLTLESFGVLDPAGDNSFIFWMENPTIDGGGYTDVLTGASWEVFDGSLGGTLIASGSWTTTNDVDHHSVFAFVSSATVMSLRIFDMTGGTKTSLGWNVGAAIAYVPEPATWIMMILGFGLIGLQMRRQARIRVEMA